MKRREFITLLGGAAAAWPLAARAQQPAMPVIGFLNSTSPRHYTDPAARISSGPEGSRLCRGRERRDRIPLGRGPYDRLPALAAELVRRQVAVIVAMDTASALAAKAATTTIPIVFAPATTRSTWSCRQPQPAGRQSHGRGFPNELAAKRLELLRELVPAANIIAMLVNPTDSNARPH